MKKLLLALIIVTTVSLNSSYRILAVFPHGSKSHFIVFEALLKGLAKHGHQVDVISHYPLKKPLKNYNDIINLTETRISHKNSLTVSEAQNIDNNVVNFVGVHAGNNVCRLMGLESIQKIVKNPPKDPAYDLVITEAFGAHCYMGFGYVLKVPVVVVSSGLDYPWISYFTGNDDNLAYVSNALFRTGSAAMNFQQRLMNVVVNYYELFKFHRITYETQTKLMRRYLDPNIPNIREIERNVALTLVNTHPILSGVKPITPALIQIAGIHIEMNDETLPQDLKKWMDDSSDGVVYFSLGSKILLESFPESQLRQIFASFAKIHPVRVLMRFADSTKLPVDLPANVKPMLWIPQQPVLAHPNTKVFINHGGLGGIQEALYYGIPMLGIPLFGDQFGTVDRFVEKQMMIKIEYEKLSESSFDSALQALLDQPIYKEKAMYYSKLFRDHPISPMNNAVFWIEYVIRNGPNVLKSPALQLPLLQLTLLDVYAVLILSAVLFILISFFIVKILIKKLKKKHTARISKMKSP